jgi:hypothetical protein
MRGTDQFQMATRIHQIDSNTRKPPLPGGRTWNHEVIKTSFQELERIQQALGALVWSHKRQEKARKKREESAFTRGA